MQKIEKINVVSTINPDIWKRQIPNSNVSEFERLIFTSKPVAADIYVFYGTDQLYSLPNTKALCIYFIVEPRNLKANSNLFLKQFDAIFGSIPLKYRNSSKYFTSQPGLPWHIGIDFSNNIGFVKQSYDDLLKRQLPSIEAVSVLTSNKIISNAHYRRFKFVQDLSDIMGPLLHVYGRGFNPVSDKGEILNKYRYHLSLENNLQEDYWSEKLADPLIALNKVFYSGAPNINKYFSNRAVKLIDINNPLETAQLILLAVQNRSWEKDIDVICAEKERILNEFNFINLINNLKVSSDTRHREYIYGDFLIRPSRLIKKLKWKIIAIFKNFRVFL